MRRIAVVCVGGSLGVKGLGWKVDSWPWERWRVPGFGSGGGFGAAGELDGELVACAEGGWADVCCIEVPWVRRGVVGREMLVSRGDEAGGFRVEQHSAVFSERRDVIEVCIRGKLAIVNNRSVLDSISVKEPWRSYPWTD